MNQQAHFFYAIRIPETTKLIMKSHLEKFKETLPFKRWVHHTDLHITLAFLGAATQAKLREAEINVTEALTDEKSLTLKINRLGIFGMKESPRVFWADIEKSSGLESIREKVFSACETAGFQLETRPFRPHITLARKWNGEQLFQLNLLDIWNGLQPDPLPFMTHEVVLYQTHLDQIPKYEAINVFPLQT